MIFYWSSKMCCQALFNEADGKHDSTLDVHCAYVVLTMISHPRTSGHQAKLHTDGPEVLLAGPSC